MVVENKDQVFSFLREHRDFLASKGVRKIGLFGSFIKNQQRPDSDLDFLVDFDPQFKTFDTFMELAFFLEDNLERKVDLVTTEGLSPFLATTVNREVEFFGVR